MYSYEPVLYHHGVKGQKWGVRRYQYSDGTLTPAGKKRYQSYNSKNPDSTLKYMQRYMDEKVSYIAKRAATQITGKQYVDTYLKSGTTLARIQTSKEFENFAFYATYKKQDKDKYMGLFGKNLMARANKAAKVAEEKARKTGDPEDIATAKELREKSDNMKVYQLHLSSTKKLKIPSDQNAADITTNLLKRDGKFKENVTLSIEDSKAKMKRPSQQMLFNQAQKALEKDLNKLTSAEKQAIYKALNLSLTNHNSYEIEAQSVFYGELKKKGYNALLDYNDKEFSSYHAKRPMIVFDVDSVTLQSVTETDPKIVDKLYTKYNAERMRKEVSANTLKYAGKLSKYKLSELESYMTQKLDDYLNK